jgi:hypothetical protein
MDETPEELAEIRREAEQIDPNKYRRRYRLIMTLLASLFFVGVAWVAISMAREARNPCERVRDHFCMHVIDRAKCSTYDSIFKESVEDESAKMRSMIRDQCLTKITRLKEEDGITVK